MKKKSRLSKRSQIGSSPLTRLFQTASPSVIAFISKLTKLPAGIPPIFPPIFGTGFLVGADGTVVTNRHVVDVFARIPKNPKTGESGLAALMFLPGTERGSWQMLVVDVRESHVLETFTSSDRWYGETIPDLGFVQLGVREVPFLRMASEDSYLKIGMDIATIGFPMGTLPLTTLGKLNQVTPFLRHGVVSSLYPFPTAKPHGFTIDIMQQGGSSGSPIFRTADGRVVGMMSSGVIEQKMTRSDQASLVYTVNTNISIAEPSGIIEPALEEYRKHIVVRAEGLPTLAELRAKHPLGSVPQDLTWDSWQL
jgi:S1-C subfamily serine protease